MHCPEKQIFTTTTVTFDITPLLEARKSASLMLAVTMDRTDTAFCVNSWNEASGMLPDNSIVELIVQDIATDPELEVESPLPELDLSVPWTEPLPDVAVPGLNFDLSLVVPAIAGPS